MEIKESIHFESLQNKIGFRLLSLELSGSKLMGKSHLRYNFNDNDESTQGIYTTVIIGANGTGKSNLFRIIIEILKELYDLSKENEVALGNINGRYLLKFTLKNEVYEFGNMLSRMSLSGPVFQVAEPRRTRRKPILLRNNERIRFSDFDFPITIVANAITLHDKYPFYRQIRKTPDKKVDAFPYYKYLGVRNTPQSTSTRAYVRRTVEYIVEQLDSTVFRNGLSKTTDFLGLAESLEIIYTTSNTRLFFKGDLTREKLQHYFIDIKEGYAEKPTRPPFKLEAYLKIADDIELLNRICYFVNELANSGKLEPIENSYNLKLTYDILDDNSFKELQLNYDILDKIRQLGIITTPNINLKREEGYSLQESSSGEYHFLSSVVGLLATVKENSLVLIDEPEISLHPNWQMKYLSFLRELFSGEEYKSVHFLVATHSHFLISDLKGESSTIIGLKREEGRIATVDLPPNLDTYGWSTDDVLYKIFGVRTTRNYYMEVELRELLSSISSKSQNKYKLQSIVTRLEQVKINERDPLNLILQNAKEYIRTL